MWEEAEKLARKVGRRVLKCGRRVPNDAILGELGWTTMRGRRMLLRLSYWGKILAMDDGRWVKKVYMHGKARLDANPGANTWCNLTRKWLLELGLKEEWEAQEVGAAWQEKLRAAIEGLETRNRRRRVVKNAKLEEYAKWKSKPEKEDYLEHADTHQRRLWTKLRSGCLELRVETGRWERVSVGGRQVPVPRPLRKCELCFGGVENAHHVLFRCPAYVQQRRSMAAGVRASAPPGAVAAMTRVQAGGHYVDELVVMRWLMAGGGHGVGMEALEGMMLERKKMLGERG